MIGAIAGDIIGSRHEFRSFKSKEFQLFTGGCKYTDDSLMTLAVAEAFILWRGKEFDEDFKRHLIRRMVDMGRKHQANSWGLNFYKWFMENPVPYGSMGNGAAMRISPVGWVAKDEDEVRLLSRTVTEVSHNHPDALIAAEAVSMAIFMGREGYSKEDIRKRMLEYYPEISGMTVSNLRAVEYMESGIFITCRGSVPQAIVCFLEGEDYEDSVRNAISLGGDADTQGAITGSIAEAYYGVPDEIEEKALSYLTDSLRSIYYAFSTVRRKRKNKKKK